MAGRKALDETQLPAQSAGVRVFVRLRPPDEGHDIEMFEFPQNKPGLVTIKDPLSAGRSEHAYEFNGIFQVSSTQEQVFTSVAQAIVDAAVKGKSGCVLAYGQTGSGKTHSIFGGGSNSSRGLLPRAVERLLPKVKAMSDFSNIKDSVNMSSATMRLSSSCVVSFLEVYLDQVHDLGRFSLEEEVSESNCTRRTTRSAVSGLFHNTSFPSSIAGSQKGNTSAGRNTALNTSKESLDIRETPSGVVQVRGLTRLPVEDFEDVQRIIDKGTARRATAITAANIQSSRSHTVFTVYLPKQPEPKSTSLTDSEAEFDDRVTLNFVDLAGSERLAKSKAEGARFQEAVSINSSLTALGKVILALATDAKAGGHVPYRDSKLTRLLSASFALGTNVALLATLHPRVEDYEECLHTLAWAHRCKNVKRQEPQVTFINKKKSNEIRITDLQSEIARLKIQIFEAKAATAIKVSQAVAAAGVTGIGASGHVDEIEMQIAKAIISDGKEQETLSKKTKASVADPQADRTSAATTPLDHASTSDRMWVAMEDRERRNHTVRERSIAALVSLQEERGRQAQAHEQADTRMNLLEKERSELTAFEEMRAVSTAELQQRGLELEDDLSRLHEKLRKALEAQNEKHWKELGNLALMTEQRLQQADEVLLRIPDQLRDMQDVAEQKREELENARKLTEGEHIERVGKICKDHETHLKELKKQGLAVLDEKEVTNYKSAREVMDLQESQKIAAGKSQNELLLLYEQVVQFSKLVQDMDDGKHPIVWRGGNKEVVLPPGARPELPNAEAHPCLFHAIGKEDENLKASSCERVVQRPPSSGRQRRVGSGGIAAVAAAEAIRKETEAALEVIAPGWDAAAVARRFCNTDDTADAILAKHSGAHLRRLCVELRDQSLELFAPGEEREALRRMALNALEDGGTDNYIRELQQRRSMEQDALSETVQRAVHLQCCLSSRKSSIAATSNHASRSNSRPMTPMGGRQSHPGSRSGSRPGTATSSKPPPGYPQRVSN